MMSIIFDFEQIKAELERLKVEREVAEAEVAAQAEKAEPVTLENAKEFTFLVPIELWGRGVGGSN